MNNLSIFFQLFQKGREVANPAAWKNGQITVNTITPILFLVVELGRNMGYKIPVDEITLSAFAGVILAVVNCVLTVITSKKVGIDPVDSSRELPSVSEPAITEPDKEPTRASLGYERVGPSANDRAGG